jgi:serine/threonine-protein kinase RIM15
MADDNFLVAPAKAVATLKDASATQRPDLSLMERTPSMAIREEREDLKEAAGQTLNIILDLGLDGTIRWVSPSWQDVIGTPVDSVKGKPIADIVIDNNEIFSVAVERIKNDDSKSHIIRFAVSMGPLSKLATDPIAPTTADEDDGTPSESKMEANTLLLEGQGILVNDRTSGRESHTMWMLRPAIQREITIDLSPVLVESLGVGAEVLSRYLVSLAEFGVSDPENVAPPLPQLCRICERQIPPWWFEKHSELCMQEHKAELDVQMAQETLMEHRNAIVKVLDTLEARTSRPSGGDTLAPAQAEYNGLPIGPSSSSSSGTASPASPPVRSREPSTTGFGHGRGRSFAVRRPQAKIVELLLDLCDTAIEINTPAIKETPSQGEGMFRTQSPSSENSVSQVLQWQSPSTNTLEQEQGLAALCADTEKAARAKVESILRHRRILEYSERIRIEFHIMVQDCIGEAMRKAERIAEGHLTDSSSESGEERQQEHDADDDIDDGDPAPTQEEGAFFTGSFDSPSAISTAMKSKRSASDPTLLLSEEHRTASPAGSDRSRSSRDCPTPRSHHGAVKITSQPKRYSMHFDSEAGDSDSSYKSSTVSAARRTESPVSEHEFSRRTSVSRDRKRSSLIMTTGSAMAGAMSPRRGPSPARNMPSSSPLRITKPRGYHDVLPSPITSPLLSAGDLMSPNLESFHHRRQSSAASSDLLRHGPPASPRMIPVSQPQARAVPPSIKDFEIIKPISKGAFGSVYLSKKKSTGEYFAIKVLRKADMIAKNQVSNVKAERAIMMWQGESDFVAKLYWTFSSKDCLYLVMEYLNGGDCAALIKSLGALPEDWAKSYLAEVVLGLEHLHVKGIVHRDMKPDNLLIDQKGHLKLTDFGLSRMGLLGRQKRVLAGKDESTPDLLKQGPFAPRSLSVASSRSTSMDYGGASPSMTPLMTPDLMAPPTYFALNREGKETRNISGRSESNGSETLSALFGSFSLNDPLNYSALAQRRSPMDEDVQSEGSNSSDPYSLQPINSQTSGQSASSPSQQLTTPSMLPPPMALFHPEDQNRRFVGTPDYLAPETINGIGQDEMSDWWSLGCILFEFLYGYPPFHADTHEQVFDNILSRKIDWPSEDEDEVSSEAKDLMNKLMCTNPRERLGSNMEEKFENDAGEIKAHPWFGGINWASLLDDDASFVPAPQHPEDTDYFDSRGATLHTFEEELEDQSSSPAATTPGTDYAERPYDALSRVRKEANSAKRGLMPLHIPPHVRDSRSRRLSEPLANDDFGSFAFKNLPVLDKANKDVIQKLRAEGIAKKGPTSAATSPAGPSLEGSPILPMPLKRQMSTSKNRPVSPNFSQANSSSPSRGSQPSSPLLVSFSAGQREERRKGSSGSSSLSLQSGGSLQPGNFFEGGPRLSTTFKTPGIPASAASSPIKSAKSIPPAQMSPQKSSGGPRTTSGGSRSRSHTVGSQDGDLKVKDLYSHHKRRSQVIEMSPSSSDNEGEKASALLRVHKRRQSSRRMSAITLQDGPMFRPLDILICEDHPVSRMVLVKLLEKLQCRTMTVDNGAEAIRVATSEVKFDIIMMEFKLPQANGEDVARMIRDTKNTNSRTPIVAVTGYLKEIKAREHFDCLIEKPPTADKLSDALARLCQWKPPGQEQSQQVFPSGLRLQAYRPDSPVSTTSSTFANMPGSSFRGSSREDSIGSSFFGDSESTTNDDIPVVINRDGQDWGEGGLGISEGLGEPLIEVKQPIIPHLLQQQSAPAQISSFGLELPRSDKNVDKVKSKRLSIEPKHQGGESGDDEDEELGSIQTRTRSPTRDKRAHRSSKLGYEMMRTNSRGSIISGSGQSVKDGSSPPPSISEDAIINDDDFQNATITPPVTFPQVAGDSSFNIRIEEPGADVTPRPSLSSYPSTSTDATDATPRPGLQSYASNTSLLSSVSPGTTPVSHVIEPPKLESRKEDNSPLQL